MKKTLAKSIAIILVITITQTTLLAGNLPFSIKQKRNQFNGNTKLEITSLQDGLNIKSIVVNRGKCTAIPQYLDNQMNFHNNQIPSKLNYGEYIFVQLPGCSQLLEVRITTNKGTHVLEP
jgi:hypothetical protein